MKKHLVGFLVITVYCLTFGGSTCMADSERCSRVIEHIGSVAGSGDLAIGKLLIDHAVDSTEILCCSTKQKEAMTQLRRDIYIAYILDRMRIAKTEVLDHIDGRAALRNMFAAVEAAETVGVTLGNVDVLAGAAFFAAGLQDLEEAETTEQEGNPNRANRLREEAAKFFSHAMTLDPRIEALVKKIPDRKNLLR